MNEDKNRESRLRGKLDRMSYRLIKSRSRDDRVLGYGGFMILDKWKNVVVDGAVPHAFSLSLDDVETLTKNRPRYWPR